MSWIKPVFNSEEDGGPSGGSAGREADDRRDSNNSDRKRRLLRNAMWTDQYAPTDIDRLAVHVKKVQEFDGWLSQSALGFMGSGPIALLVGPSGAGKTATLRAVASNMNVTVKEWVNPTIHKTDSAANTGQGGFTNQVDQFEDFLFRASRYQDLFAIGHTKTLLLVEDIPNVFIRDSSLLEISLRKYAEVGRSPLIFICTNGSNEFNLERMLFKPKMITELKITTISFNPINKTLMCKALERVIKAARRDNPELLMKGTVRVEDIAANANGDIRYAVNHLQLLLTGVEEETVVDKSTGVATKSPTHDPEEISSKMSSVPNLFHGLLTENYPGVMNDMNNISEASSLLSQTDVMMSGHTDGGEKDLHKTYAVNVSVHGLMNLPPNQAQRKFYPFKGSRLKEVNVSASERLKKFRFLFPASCLQPLTMLTEVCPFLAHMDMGALSSDRMNLIHEVAQLTSISSRSFAIMQPPRKVEDGANGEESEVVEAVAVTEVVTREETVEKEVINIEDFSDDDIDEH